MIRFIVSFIEDAKHRREEAEFVRRALDPYEYALGAEEQELPPDVPRIPWKGSLWPL